MQGLVRVLEGELVKRLGGLLLVDVVRVLLIAGLADERPQAAHEEKVKMGGRMRAKKDTQRGSVGSVVLQRLTKSSMTSAATAIHVPVELGEVVQGGGRAVVRVALLQAMLYGVVVVEASIAVETNGGPKLLLGETFAEPAKEKRGVLGRRRRKTAKRWRGNVQEKRRKESGRRDVRVTDVGEDGITLAVTVTVRLIAAPRQREMCRGVRKFERFIVVIGAGRHLRK